MTTETMREAVARAIFEQESYVAGDDKRVTWEDALADERPFVAERARRQADAAIRTVLERLREPGDVILKMGVTAIDEYYSDPESYPPNSNELRAGWQAMLDAAAREVG